MTLRIRYYLAILPLFIGLGLVNSLLVYSMERNELRWSMQERAQGIAASIAGFWGVMGPDNGRPALLKRYSQRLGGISVRRFGPSAGGDWQVHELFAAQLQFVPQPPPPDADVSASLQQQHMGWSLLPQLEESWDLIAGYAALIDAEGATQGVIGISTRETGYREEMASLRLRLIGLLLALLIAGIAVAEFITRMARRELGALTAAADDATHGRYLTQLPPGRIRELNDLGGTLLTMTSLLSDESHQTRRAFFRAELLPGQNELAVGYRNYLEQPLPLPLGAERYAIRRLGDVGISDFCGWRQSENGWILVLGRAGLPQAASAPLLGLICADATRDYLLGVASDPLQTTQWAQALTDFPCECFQIVEMSADGQVARVADLGADGKSMNPWVPVYGRVVFGTLAESAARVALSYLQQFPDRLLEQVADELAGLMKARFSGILVLCDFPASGANERNA